MEERLQSDEGEERIHDVLVYDGEVEVRQMIFSAISKSIQQTRKMKEDEESSQRRLKDMWEKKKLTDVVLVCDGGEVEAHRLILSIRSAYFQKMFLSDFNKSSTNRVDFSYVRKEIMVLILDYIYLHEVKILEKESVDNLMQVYQFSRLFEIDELNKYCWKLILKNINTDYWFRIWELVLHANDEDICKILDFILENLLEIVRKFSYTITYSQIKHLMEKISEHNFPVDDDFLEAIILWSQKTNQPKTHLQTIFLQINFDFVSREFITDLWDKEKDLIEDPLFKQFFESQFIPKLKTKSELHLPLKLFFFRLNGKSLLPGEVFGIGRLEIFDCETKSAYKVIDDLPFCCTGCMTPIQCGSDIYIIGGIPSGYPIDSRKKSFFLYDWKENQIVIKPFLLEAVTNPFTCISKNAIYIIETDSENPKTFIQYFSLSEQKWFSKKYSRKDLSPFACVSVNDVIYLFSDKSYDEEYGGIVLFTVNKLAYTFHSTTPIPVCPSLNRKNVIVYEGKIIVLIQTHHHYVLYTFNPDTHLWNIRKTSIPCDDEFIYNSHTFFANKFIMFYSEKDHTIYQSYANNVYIKKIMTVDGSRDEDHVKKFGECVYERFLLFH